jgi:hypothetical protein
MKEIFFLLTIFLISFSNQVISQKREDTLYFSNFLQPVTEENIFKAEEYYNWCPSIIKEKDGLYHLFYSRWKKEYSFSGWLTHSEVAHAISNNPCGPWHFKETVMTGRGKEHWDAITVHNPKIKYFDGKYYLYYISTNMGNKEYTDQELIETAKMGSKHPNWWSVLRANQRTGVAISSSINGPWVRLSKSLIEPSGPISNITVNPAITQGKDGKYYLIVKGDKPSEKRFIRNQAIAISNFPEGPFEMQQKPVIDYIDTEDVSMWYDRKRDYYYAVFHSTQDFIGMVSSCDGINWEKALNYIIMPKIILMSGNRLIKPDRLERPFIYIEDNEPKVLSLAVKKNDESYIVFIPIIKENLEVLE